MPVLNGVFSCPLLIEEEVLVAGRVWVTLVEPGLAQVVLLMPRLACVALPTVVMQPLNSLKDFKVKQFTKAI